MPHASHANTVMMHVKHFFFQQAQRGETVTHRVAIHTYRLSCESPHAVRSTPAEPHAFSLTGRGDLSRFWTGQ